MNHEPTCSHCGAPLAKGESDAVCPVCLLAVGLSGGDVQVAADRLDSVGRYQLLEKIGQGGMGQVYKARDSQLGRTVAIKFLPIELAESAENLQRFQREATTLSQLNHPNICIIYDVGNAERGPYIVMEYVRGQSLGAILDTTGLTIDQTVDIMLQICAGIEVIHEQGIIHRDIKPSNVMLTEKDGVKLVDFGLAKWNSHPESEWTLHENANRTRAEFVETVPGQVVGTPSYMSPEQAAGQAVDSRSDIFSMGALFYGMLAGEPPFRGETPMLTIHAIISRHYRPIREVNPDIPVALASIVDRMLAEREDRFQTVSQIVPLLKQLQAGVVTGQAATVAAAATAPDSIAPGRSKRVWILAPVLCLLLAAWYFSGLGPWRSTDTPAPPGLEPLVPGFTANDPAAKPLLAPPPASNVPEEIDPIEHHFVLGAVVDPAGFVDQLNAESRDVMIGNLHRKLQRELAEALQESGFPVAPVTNDQWDVVKETTFAEQGGFDYGLSVASLLKQQRANLFLSLSGYRDDEKQAYTFKLHFFNLAGQAFLSKEMAIPIESVEANSARDARQLFVDWLAETFQPEQGVSRGASLEGGGEKPPIEGIVVLPAFEEGQSPYTAFECIDSQRRAELQHQIAERLRDQLARLSPAQEVKISTPTSDEWREANDSGNPLTWRELLGPFAANAVLGMEGTYDETLKTYGVELNLNQMGTIHSQGQHRFAFTEEEFRENFDEVARQLLAAPILSPADHGGEPTDED
ncbi:MAG: serine/threonine protein kinase [Mariniblastus sp.]|nr:serine/threonine protein kinase [Mariniblastus sp.]